MHPEKKWLSVADMMARYGISRATLHRREAAGEIPRADRGDPGRPRRPRWWRPAVEAVDETRQRHAQAAGTLVA
jgi:predicted DNA-binding transcriptional regulator AlpA